MERQGTRWSAVPLLLLLAVACGKSDADCERDTACKFGGACFAEGGRCVAKSEEICVKSPTCKTFGNCALFEQRCAPTRDEHCRQASDCHKSGKCAFVAKDHSCRPGSRADCERSDACTKAKGAERLCRFDPSRQGCVGPSVVICADSPQCEAEGKCTPETVVTGLAAGADPTRPSADDLRKAVRCVVASDADCARSRYCRYGGSCTKQGATCATTRDEDCRRSERCRETGECSLPAGKKSCVAARDEDCRAARACAVEGACSLVGDRCAAKTDADCAKSEVCRARGQCWAIVGAIAGCVPRTEADCKASEYCKKERRCKLRQDPNRYPRCDL